MTTYPYENKIGFHLTKVKGAAAKRGVESYRAVLGHDALDAEETLAELAKKTGIPDFQLRYIGSALLSTLFEGTMSDGRSRNFENFVTTRLDISGKFDRIDSPFDEKKHACVLGIIPGAKIAEFKRKLPPINETKPPRGRFDYITHEGGEKTFVKCGQDILIYGHDLKLEKSSNYIIMTTYDKSKTRQFFATIAEGRTKLDPHDAELLVNTDEFLRVAWPQSWTFDKINGQTIRFHFVDCADHAAHDSYSHPVTILR